MNHVWSLPLVKSSGRLHLFKCKNCGCVVGGLLGKDPDVIAHGYFSGKTCAEITINQVMNDSTGWFVYDDWVWKWQ